GGHDGWAGGTPTRGKEGAGAGPPGGARPAPPETRPPARPPAVPAASAVFKRKSRLLIVSPIGTSCPSNDNRTNRPTDGPSCAHESACIARRSACQPNSGPPQPIIATLWRRSTVPVISLKFRSSNRKYFHRV